MYPRSRLAVLLATAILCHPVILLAQYTLVLKNGRRITVQAYREEANMIKFNGAGGEIGIARDQVQSILRVGQPEGRGLDLRDVPAGDAAEPSEEGQKQSARSAEETRKSAVEPREIFPEAERAKEEGEYQAKLINITSELDTLKNRYLLATRGGDSEADTAPQKAMEAWAAELSSKIKDSVNRPLSEYSPKEREFSELRDQIDQLQKEREKVVQQMNERGFESSPSHKE
jgi:hypothetical protein